MQGWLIVNGFLKSKKFNELTEMFIQAVKEQDVTLSVYKNSELLVNLGGDFELSFWNNKVKPDFIIFWDKDILLGRYLEMLGIRLFNSSECVNICDDKRKTHLALQKAHISMPKTIFAPMSYKGIGFTEIDFLNAVEQKLSYPMIVKEAYGSFGAQVYMAKNRKELEDILSDSSTELLFQEFVASSKGRDIRLQVVGDEVIGSMYRYSETDFRANVSAGGSMKRYIPTKEECDLAIKTAKAVGADFAGVDLLFGENGPIVCEVNSNAHFKNLMDCAKVNTAEKIIAYIRKEIICGTRG